MLAVWTAAGNVPLAAPVHSRPAPPSHRPPVAAIGKDDEKKSWLLVGAASGSGFAVALSSRIAGRCKRGALKCRALVEQRHGLGVQEAANPKVGVEDTSTEAAEEAELKRRVADYLDKVGGSSTFEGLARVLGKKNTGPWKDFLRKHFNVSERVRSEENSVSAHIPLEEVKYNLQLTVKNVVRHLVRNGGSAELADTTRRFSISSKTLLGFAQGKLFQRDGDRLLLAGGARRVAEAGKKLGRFTTSPGRITDNSLFTTQGVALDEQEAAVLQLKIEALLMSHGDGLLPASEVQEILGLPPSTRLKRWYKRIHLHLGASGDMVISEHKLNYFRVRRAVSVSEFLISKGGSAPVEVVANFIHNPPEFDGLWSEKSAPWMRDMTRKKKKGKRSEEAEDASKEEDAGEEEVEADAEADVQAKTAEENATALAKTDADAKMPAFPVWLAVWIQDYFEVQDGIVSFPPDPRRSKGPGVADPYAQAPELTPEEEGKLMAVAEELRLRYNRAHQSSISGMFRVNSSWIRRFFDITHYGDVVPKSAIRQMQEAVAIARRLEDGAEYTAAQALQDFGMARPWLEQFFSISETGVLSFDRDAKRKWTSPPKERMENPWKYYKLDAPATYIWKASKANNPYGRQRYGKAAGGIMF